MKSKKLISFLCAAAMTVSSFAGLAITASAADETLFSNSFNGNEAGIFLDGNVENAATDADNVVPGLTFVTTNRASGDRGDYTNAAGETVHGGSHYAIMADKADASDKYLRLSYPVFGDFGRDARRWAHVDFAEPYTATADKDIVMDFDLKLTDAVQGDAKGEVPVLRIGTFDTSTGAATSVNIDKSSNNMGDDWVKVRIITTNSGSKLYINGAEVTAAAAASVKSLATIGLYSADGQGNCGQASADIVGDSTYDKDGTMNTKTYTTPYADIDNLVIYKADAGSITASSPTKTPEDVQGGQSGQETIEDLEKVAGKAPKLTAPEGAVSLTEANFDSDAVVSTSMANDGVTTDLANGKMKMAIGGRTDGDGTTKMAVVNVTGGSKAVKLTGGKFSNGGRTPRLYPADSLKVGESGDTSVIGFSVYTGKTSPESVPGFWLIDTNEVNDTMVDSGDSKWSGRYDNSESASALWKGVYAYFTAEDFEEGAYTFGGSKNRGIKLTPNEWHTVVMTVSSDAKYRVFVDGQYKVDGQLAPAVNDEVLSYGTGAYAPTNLPVIAAENAASVKNTALLIDNVLTYKFPADAEYDAKYLPTVSEEEEPDVPEVETHAVDLTVTGGETVKVTTTEETPFDAVLIHAQYNGTTLASVKTYPLTGISATGATATLNPKAIEGDKLMVWDSLKGMVPYMKAHTVGTTEGAAKVKITNETAANAGGKLSFTEEVAQGSEVEITITPDTGYELDKLTVGGADVAANQIKNGKYTFKANADTTVKATFKKVAYKVTVTKPAATDGTLAVDKETANYKDTVTITATAASGKAVDKVTVKAGTEDVTVTAGTNGKYTFEMPAIDVTVSATFKTDGGTTDPSTSPDPDANKVTVKLAAGSSANADVKVGTADVTSTGIKVDKTDLKITVTPKTGNTLSAVEITGGTPATVFAAATHAAKYETNVTATGNEVTVKVTTAAATVEKKELSADFEVKVDKTTATVGDTVTASLQAKSGVSATAPTVTWKWQKKDADADTYSDVSGATAAAYVTTEAGTFQAVATLAADTDTYKAGSVTSDAVEVTAAPDPELAGTLTLKVDTVDATETAPKVFDTLTAAYAPAEGEDDVEVTYAWSVGDTAEGEFTPIAEAEGETYDIPTDKLGKFIKVTATAEGYAEEGVSVTTLAVADIPVPTLAGTEIDKNDFSTEGDTWGFVPYKSGSVENSNGELILNNKADANSTADKQTDYKVFPEVISQAKNLEMIFDFTPDIESGKNRNVYLIISDDEAGMALTGHSILTVFAQGDTGVTVKAGATEAVKVADVGTNSTKLKIYLKYTAEPTPHVDVLVFNIAGGDPVCVAKTSGDIADATAFNRLAARYGYSAAPFRIDNVQINSTDEGLIPVTVKTPTGGKIATDAPAVAVKDNVITITPTADPGKKLDKVTVNGEEVTDNEGYKYTVTGEETEGKIEIDATFVRADVTEIKVDGPTMIKKGTTKDYKAIVKAGDYTFTDDDNVEITWSLADETQDQAATVQDGTAITGTSLTGALAAAAGETASKIRVKAEVVTDVKSPATKTPAYATVEFVDEDVYKVTSVAEGHGKVELKADAQAVSYIKKSSELTIETTPDEGYEVESISYTMGAEGEPQNVDKSSAKINANTLTDDTVVTVKFKAKQYTVTNNDSTNDGNGNKIEVDKETATVEDTVKITPTLGDSYAIKSLTAKKNGTDPIALTEAADGTFSFKMVADNVTVDAEFVKVQEVTLSAGKVKTSSVNFKSPETNCVESAEFKAGQAIVSGDKLASSNMTYDECSTAALINIDASEYANKIYGMKLSLSSQTDVANKNTWFKYFGQFENYISDLTTVNGNNINTTGGKASVVIDTGKENWDYGTGKNTFAALTDLNMNAYFMKNGAQQNKDGQVTMFIGTGTGRMTTVKEVTIKLIVEDEG